MTNAPYLAAGRPRRLPLRQHRARRRDHRRRAVVRVRRLPDGPRHRALHRPATISREQQDDLRREVATSGPRTRSRTAASTTRSSPVPIAQRRGEPLVVEHDEGVRPGTTVESLAGLRAGVRQGRHDHRRQRLQLSDGASAVIVMSRAGGRAPRASRRSVRSSPTAWSPAPTTRRCCTSRAGRSSRRSSEAGIGVGDVDLFEINEAFAAVGIASMADLGITDEIANVNGGAIALGHPIGMSGNRLALTAAARAAPPWRRHRRRRPVRRRRPGRRADPALCRLAKRNLGARSRITQPSTPSSRSENSRARLPFASSLTRPGEV